MIQMIPTIRQDFIAVHLRTQINRLHHVLDNMEQKEGVDYDFTNKSLKDVEISLRYIRKICSEN